MNHSNQLIARRLSYRSLYFVTLALEPRWCTVGLKHSSHAIRSLHRRFAVVASTSVVQEYISGQDPSHTFILPISLAASSVGGSFGFGLGTLPLAFCDVVSLANSLQYGIISGAPGIYLRRTSGTLTP